MKLNRFGRYVSLSILASLVLMCSPCLASAYTYTITALVDGESDLIIQGNTVQWHNLQHEVPGLLWDEGEENYTLVPTTIFTVNMDPAHSWNPWSAEGTYPDDYTGDKWSNVFSPLDQPLPDKEQIVTISVLSQIPIQENREGQGTVEISQDPLSGNGYTLIVKFDDVFPSGAAWYTIELNTTPVPLPGAVWLLGTGLAGLLALGGRRHRRG